MEPRYWQEHDNVNTRLNHLNEKLSLMPWGLKECRTFGTLGTSYA